MENLRARTPCVQTCLMSTLSSAVCQGKKSILLTFDKTYTVKLSRQCTYVVSGAKSNNLSTVAGQNENLCDVNIVVHR